jgi:hypothetical protein
VVAGTASLGGFLLLTQFVSLGILILGTAGGTLGGYLLRLKQEKNAKTAQLSMPTEPLKPRLISPNNKSS